MNKYQGNKIQKSLLEKNLSSWRPVSTQKGRLKVLVLTDKGKRAILDVRIEKLFHKKGSWEHEYWKYRVGEYYRKRGYKITYEYKIDEGKSVDVVAEKDGKKIAIEIETGKSDSIYNIRKDLEAGFDRTICVTLNNKTKGRIMMELKGFGLDKDERIKLLEFNELFQFENN